MTQLTPTLRTYTSNNFLLGWFEETDNITLSLDKQLRKWVEFRNKLAHGGVDTNVAEEWSTNTENIIKNCLIVFNSILPSLDKEKEMKLSSEFKNLKLNIPLLYKEQIFVIRSISEKQGIWQLKGQLVSKDNAEEFIFQLDEKNIFSLKGEKSIEKYNLIEFISNNQECLLNHNIPIRQTNTFVGRESEMQQLKEWMDDEDSRYALVYGDGGYGKTTLVLEFFNNIIENGEDFEQTPPTLISYYTAKKTRWSENGLIYIPTIKDAMDECIRELMRYFYPVLPRDWYQTSGKRLIQKAENVLKQHSYTRNEILFIIDNTETLASTQEEVKELGLFFKLMGKKLGRIIITSRRREFIESTPIPIEGLKEAESVRLMINIAKTYNAKAILDSGEANLRKLSNKLMHKPLLIDALVKYIAHSTIGIEKAMNNLFQKSNEDLFTFLYEDAWQRMNSSQQEVFYVITYIKSPLNEHTIKKICQEIEIPYTEFLNALEETHFVIKQEYTRDYSMQLTSLSERFFQLQFEKLTIEKRKKFTKISQRVDKYLENKNKIEQAYKIDRTAGAFRNEFAKFAKVYGDQGKHIEAIEMYEVAIKEDLYNSALHEKFALFLLTKTQEFEYAKNIALKSVELNSNNIDATVILALIYYRLMDIENGDKYIDTANKLGRNISFCLLQKGIGRYHFSKQIANYDESIILLKTTLKLLEGSELQNPRECGYDYKNLDNAISYIEKTRKALKLVRTKRTKRENEIKINIFS